jgi:pimeloyl-ACP methyl ester carboxylesterase
MWAPQMADFLSHFQVLRYDTRGHGASDAPKGDYAVELLGRDVLSLADALALNSSPFAASPWAVQSASGWPFTRRNA